MFSVLEIVEATGGSVVGNNSAVVSGVSTDSRSVAPGELFVPLKGERFDGHDFIGTALERGVGVILAHSQWLAAHPLPEGISAVAVPDTLKALGDLAAYYRRRFDIPVVAITGSNGKTTTKEMLARILGQGGPGLKTEGNLNNLIGLPLTLLRLTGRHRWAVVELGMSEFGEIDRLAEIAAPTVGVITNAFPAHLETLGSVEGVAKAKGELFLRLKEGNWAAYNVDDPLISKCRIPLGVTSLTFGLRGAEVSSAEIVSHGAQGQSFTLRLPGEELPVRLGAFGRHNVYNALAAAAAAHALGIGGEQIRRGLEEFTPADKRFQLEQLSDVILVDDSYNANPASMAAALTTVKEVAPGRAFAALGDMLELGSACESGHKEVGALAAGCLDRLYLFGPMAMVVAQAAIDAGMDRAKVFCAKNHDELIESLLGELSAGDTVLVKGSRGMAMERVAQAVRESRAAKGGNA